MNIFTALAPFGSISCLTAADWSCWRGSSHNGSAGDPGIALIDDINKAKLLWTSTEDFPPMAGTRHIFKESHKFFFYGGYGDPVTADNKVFVYYYRPSGPIDDKGAAAFVKGRPPVKSKNTEAKRVFHAKHVPECYRVDADDVVVCLDANTGTTLWKQEFKEQGFNYNIPNGQAYTIHGIPCVGDGKVFVLGSGAIVHAMDTNTGTALWSTPVGPAADNMIRWKTRYRETGQVTKHMGEMKKTMCQTIVYADGVVACSDVAGAIKNLQGGPARGGAHCGMVAFDAESGEKLWTHPDCIAMYNAPLPWRHADQTYFIASNLSQIACVTARSGKLMWSMASTDTHVVHNGGMNGALAGDLLVLEDIVDPISTGKRQSGKLGLSCYRLSTTGATQVWRFDCGTTMGVGANDKTGMSPLIHDGHVYFDNPGRGKDMWCLDLQTGTIVARLEGDNMRYGNTVGVGQRVFTPRGLFGTGKNFKLLGRPAAGGTIKATPYCGPCIVGTRLYTRDNYKVYCYDLRQ